jgi:hypothetical protein
MSDRSRVRIENECSFDSAMSESSSLAPTELDLLIDGGFAIYPEIPRSSASGCATKTRCLGGVSGFYSVTL